MHAQGRIAKQCDVDTTRKTTDGLIATRRVILSQPETIANGRAHAHRMHKPMRPPGPAARQRAAIAGERRPHQIIRPVPVGKIAPKQKRENGVQRRRHQ